MLKYFTHNKGTKGQSAIELSLLVILVLAGVYVMSPYVVRSWNASVKGWEDSVTDSLQDPIGASPPGTFDMTCTCAWGAPCSTPPCCGYGGRPETEDTEICFCNPVGCGPAPPDNCNSGAAQGTPDINCCTTPVPLTVPDDCGTMGCALTEVPALCYCGTEPAVPHFCECQFNRNCQFQCLNPPNPADVEYNPDICPLDDLNLTINTNVTFVEEGKCSAPDGSAPKCQWECATSFVPSFSATSCDCPDGSINIAGTCVIDCGDSSGDCLVASPPPFPPNPTGCGSLTFDECEPIYGGACAWSPTLGCIQHTACSEMRTNVTLLFPPFPRCEFYPWCDWQGGGGYCCSAVQHNQCGGELVDATGCGANQVLECCQFDTLGSCRSNSQSCGASPECCSNNCVGATHPLGARCCLTGQNGVCQNGANHLGCCRTAVPADCPGGSCFN